MRGWSVDSLGNRPLVIPVALFLLGIGAGPLMGCAWWLWTAAVVMCACAAWLRGPRFGAVFLLLTASGSAGAALSTLHALEPGFGSDDERALIEAEIESVRPGFGGDRWVLEVTRLDGAPIRFRANVFASHAPAVLPGQRIVAAVKLKETVPGSNPGEWSQQLEQLRRGQTATGSVDGRKVLVTSSAAAWRVWVDVQQNALVERVTSLDDNRDATALLLTLAAGRRAELDDAVEDEFAKSGLAHILSVSGLHVAVLAMVVLAGIRWLLVRISWRRLRRFDVRRLAAPLAVPFVWAYVIFTGVQAPAVRSAVMCSLVLLALVLRRRADALSALAIAAGAMGLLDPSALFNLSVQLSFAAVAALILLSPLLRDALPVSAPDPSQQSGWKLRALRAREAMIQTLVASFAVTMASAPLILISFQRMGWSGLVSNIVALPLSGVLTLVSAGGAALFVTVPALATPVLWLGIQLSKILLGLAHVFASVPGAAIRLPGPSWSLAALWWLGLAALVFARGRWRLMSLATALAAVGLLFGPVFTPAPGLEVTFLAVGHGDAIVVSSRGRHALIDGGGVPEGSDTGRRFVLPFLRQQRIEALDLVVLSHPHPDHALGLISALEEVPTAKLWLPAGAGEGPLIDALTEAADDAEVSGIEVGAEPLVFGDAQFEVLGPPTDRVLLEGENDRSIVLRLRHGAVTFLLAGDVEEAAEEHLDPGPITVMKAPHHGSRTSSSPPFLERARPKFAVFCVGRNNRFGFPHPEVVERYEQLGTRCYRTDLDGAITFRSDGHEVQVTTFLPRSGMASRRARTASRHDEEHQQQHQNATAD